MKLCFNTIACRNEQDRLFEIIGEVAGTGLYQAVELWIPDPDTMDRARALELASLCREKGLDLPIVTSTVGVLSQQMDDLEEHIGLTRRVAELASLLGAPLVRAFPGYVGEVSGRNPDPDYYRYLVDAFAKICGVLADSNLKLASETHPDTMAETAQCALRFLEDVGQPNHGFIMQLGIAPRWSGMDAVGFYRALQPHVLHMHLHPYPWQEHEDNIEHYASLLPLLEREEPGFHVSVENCEALVPAIEAARWGAHLVGRFIAGERIEAPEDE